MEETFVMLDKVGVTLGGNPALRDIDWELKKGEHWAVLGENGAGKSTFLKLVRGEIWPDRRDGGMRIYSMDAPPSMSPIGLRNKFGIISAELQDRYLAGKWSVTGLEAVLTGFYDTPYLYVEPEKDRKEQARAIMETLDITDLSDKLVPEMSRGESAKVLMARGLVSGPSVLVLDECLSGMDGPSRRSMLAFLDRVAASGVQLLYAFHRLDELPDCITHILWLERGRVREQGERDKVLPEVRSAWHGGNMPLPARLEDFFTRAEDNPAHESDSFLIRLEEAGVVIGGKRLLHPVDWTMRHGERWIVSGRNGAGKTTFLSLIHGDLPAYGSGKVEWFGRSGPVSMEGVRRRMGYVSAAQQAHYPHDALGLEVVVSGFFATCGLFCHQEVDEDLTERAMLLMEDMGIRYLADRACGAMSYGQFRRVLLARAVVNDPDVLLLDEPMSGLDVKSRETFSALLEDFALSGRSMVHVTHYRKEIERLGTHILRLEKGRVVYQGDVESFTRCDERCA